MEFKLDKRHLIAGTVVALLLSTYMLYAGLSKPEVFYIADGSAHGTSYDTSCVECHTKKFAQIENQDCIACHGLNNYRRLEVDKTTALGHLKAQREELERKLADQGKGNVAAEAIQGQIDEKIEIIAYLEQAQEKIGKLIEAGQGAKPLSPEESNALVEFIRDEDRDLMFGFLASQQLHKAVAAQSCNDCHMEHRTRRLEEILHHPLAERRSEEGYFQQVHDLVPPDLQGEAHCRTCHLPAQDLGIRR